MPWLETDVRDQRIQFVMTARRPGANVRAVCRAFGISPKTGYKWLQREAAAGSVAVLADQSRRPHHSPTCTDAVTTTRVIALRQAFGWGGDKLAWVLAAEGIRLAPRTIDRIIQREGLTRERTVIGAAPRRFEHAAPNDLWQLDAKGPFPVERGGRCHALSVVDDHSRFAVGLAALPTIATVTVEPALRACFETYGVPRAMLMDHGSPWWSTASHDGLTRLTVGLLKQGIRLIYGAIRHPQTQGKVERFHRTLGEHLAWVGTPTTLRGFATTFARFRDEYNHIRPHEGIGMWPPAHRFAPSPRAYQAAPPRWDYPAGTTVRRVQRNGMVPYAGTLYFVSEALAGEEVGCVPLAGTGRVIVTYRHMMVREWWLHSRRSVALLQPIKHEWPREAAAPGYSVLPMS
jgi:transposase InsO family protein